MCRRLKASLSSSAAVRASLVALLVLFKAIFPELACSEPSRVRKIGVIYPGHKLDPTYRSRHEALLEGLRQLGYVDGKNIRIDVRYADGKLDRLPRIARDVVDSKVDLMVTGGSGVVLAAQRTKTTIPIVMAFTGDDPVRGGFVASLSRPGGNITGLTNISSELAPKRLELLIETVPNANPIAFVRDPSNPANAVAFQETDTAAARIKLRIVSIEAERPEHFQGAFQTAVQKGAKGLIVQSGGLFTSHEKTIVDLANRTRLPAIFSEVYFVTAGGLMAYATSIPELYRRAAVYIDKIFKGAKPGDLPVEQPTKFELVINLKTAKEIRIAIPPNVLAQADRVIR